MLYYTLYAYSQSSLRGADTARKRVLWLFYVALEADNEDRIF